MSKKNVEIINALIETFQEKAEYLKRFKNKKISRIRFKLSYTICTNHGSFSDNLDFDTDKPRKS